MLCTGPRYNSSSSSSIEPAANPPKEGALQYLCNRFYDVEAFVEFGSTLKKWNQQRKNRYAHLCRCSWQSPRPEIYPQVEPGWLPGRSQVP